MVAIFGYSRDDILAAVKDMYTSVATAPDAGFHFPVGREACRQVGYPEEMLAGLPESVLARFAGVGYPFRAGTIRRGDVVLDLGAGSGTDTLIASRLVGPAGKVWALDMTPAMVGRLRELAAQAEAGNIEVIEGSAEHIPLADGSVDVVTSNGVLNLVPDKRRAVAEIFRVLRPGGRVQIADIVIRRPVTLDCRSDPRLWAECVVGATVDEDYIALFRDAGFSDLAVLGDYDYFALSPSADTRGVARRFGARSIEIGMARRGAAPSRLARLARRADPRRPLQAIRRRGLSGVAAFLLSMLACYGTLAATLALSLLGITIAINEAAWAGAILLFALLATAAVAAGSRRHASPAPLALALAGTGILAYAMLFSYHLAAELAGFALLAAGTLLDFRRRARRPPPRAARV